MRRSIREVPVCVCVCEREKVRSEFGMDGLQLKVWRGDFRIRYDWLSFTRV